MNDILQAMASFVAGGSLGVFFFGGLFWTVSRAVASPNPGLWFAGSFLVRTLGTLAGFYFVSGGAWQRILLCLLGFWLARAPVERLTRAPRSREEAQNAP